MADHHTPEDYPIFQPQTLTSQLTENTQATLSKSFHLIYKQAPSYVSRKWTYALIRSIGSVICGSLSAFFAYVLSAVLSVYYNQDQEYMVKEIRKYCYLLIGVSSAALIFNTLQHCFWDIVGKNLTKRVREKMFFKIENFSRSFHSPSTLSHFSLFH